MKVQQEQFVYFVGKFYDPGFESEPNPESKYDLIVYTNPKFGDRRTIGSLEGIFVSDKDLENFGIESIPFKREQKEEFERIYNGKFHFSSK